MNSNFPQKHPSESFVVEVDFAFFSTLITSATVTAATVSGVDATPQNILSGAASIADGSKVRIRLIGGVAGAVYRLTFSATDGVNTWVDERHLPVGVL